MTSSAPFIGKLGDMTIHQIPNTNRGTKPNRNFANNKAAGITLHETANLRANAEQNARYFASPRKSGASVHFFVDQDYVYQSLSVVEQGWHAGDGYNGTGNQTTIALEVCVDDDVVAAWKRTIDFVRLLRAENLIGDEIFFHHHWSGKICPALLMNDVRYFKAGQRRNTAGARAKKLADARLNRDTVIAAIEAEVVPAQHTETIGDTVPNKVALAIDHIMKAEAELRAAKETLS